MLPRILFAAIGLASAVQVSGASQAGHIRGRRLNAKDVQAMLQDSLESAFGGYDAARSGRADIIEAILWPTFQSLPKNSFGRLAPKAVRHAVRVFFAREHGWLIKGLEPHGTATSAAEIHDANILRDKAPALVEALLEAQRGNGAGLGLSDVVALVGALERLVLDESLEFLSASYQLNGKHQSDDLNAEELDQVLSSWLMQFGEGTASTAVDPETHTAVKRFLAENMTEMWHALVDFEQDAARNFDFMLRQTRNPFVPQHYSFDAASQIVDSMMHNYGKWQNLECLRIKDTLMELDTRSTGRVPLGDFYSQPEGGAFEFIESVEFLREIGALDESLPSGPEVRIANYILGPSNCVASSSYFSVCCISECDSLVSELERKILAPSATPEQLAGLVANLSSSSSDAPRVISQLSRQRLASIAEWHGGEVPLHGRLFAQWLHTIFPAECPYPAIVENPSALAQSQWDDSKVESSEMKQRHIVLTDGLRPLADLVSGETQWIDEEVLPAHEQPARRRSHLGSALRVVAQLSLFLAILGAAFGTCQAALNSRSLNGPSKKGHGSHDLPLHH